MQQYIKPSLIALSASLLSLSDFSLTYAQDTTSGLVFYLPFDDSLSEKLSGSSPDTSPGITLAEGRFGGGIAATGDRSGLAYPVKLIASNWSEGSAAAWVKIHPETANTTTIITSNSYAQLLSKAGAVESDVGGTSTIQTASAIPQNVWTHIASTWKKSGESVDVSFYVDGLKVFTETRSKRTYPDHNQTMVAVWDSSAVNGSFKGNMDEVVFYERQLSDADVAALHQGPAQGTAAPTTPTGVRDSSILFRNPVIDRTGQLSVPDDARTQQPPTVPVVSSEEAPADQIAGTNWQIVSIKRQDYETQGEMKKREQLKLQVTLKKTGYNAKQPVRIAIRDTNETTPWKGSDLLTKYDIDTGVGKTITKDVLVSYHKRFEEAGNEFKFIIGLNNPDGTPFNDRKTTDHEKPMSFNIVEPTRTTNSELQEVGPATGSVNRRSKVAGRTGDYEIQHTRPEPQLLLSELVAFRDNYTALCELGVRYSPLKARDTATELKSIDVCNGAGTGGLVDDISNLIGANSEQIKAGSRIWPKATSRAVVGIRVCTSDDIIIQFPYERSLLKGEFVYRPFQGSKLDMNSQKKVVQFDTLGFGGECKWRPWSYCPKDSTGQRMVATGIEAHIEDFDTPGDRNSIVGARLMCEPLAQVVAGAN